MVTIADVATHAHVSVMTVSLVLRSTGNVSAATRERVMDSVRKLGYRPSKLAQSFKTRVSKTIGILVPDIVNPYFTQIVREIEAEARRTGYHSFLGNCGGSDFTSLSSDYLLDFYDRHVDGIAMYLDPGFDIAKRTTRHLDLMRDFMARGTPFALIGSTSVFDAFLDYFHVTRSPHGGLFQLITFDRTRAAYSAVHHLIQLGHRRIACVGECMREDWGKDFSYSQKLSGYRTALEEAGLPFDPKLVVNGEDNPGGGEQCFKRLFSDRKRRPTAVFCTGDFLAFGVMRGAYKMHVSIPADLCVFGFDNINESAFYNPSLSTVAQPIEEMGREAFRRLLLLMEGKSVSPTRIVFDTELVIRESCP
jgi:DNA-binding LacI/PurR family transcriptional regulator